MQSRRMCLGCLDLPLVSFASRRFSSQLSWASWWILCSTLPVQPGAPTYEQLASSGLVSLASAGPCWFVCRIPLVVVMGVNIRPLGNARLERPAGTPELHIVHPDDMNPFHHHWQKLESLSMETFRVFSNILADRSANRVVRLEQVRPGAFFGPGARDVVFEVPKGGLPAVVTLAHALAPASAGWLAEKRKTEADGRGEEVTLWDRAVLARPNQAGIDGLVGLSKAGSGAPVAAAAAAVSSASSSSLSSTQDPVLNGSLLVLSQSKCTEILSEPGSALTPHVAAAAGWQGPQGGRADSTGLRCRGRPLHGLRE